MIKKSVINDKLNGNHSDFYKIIRNNLVKLYLPDLLANIILTIIGESFAVYYTYQVQELIKFIKEPVDDKNPEGQNWRGVQVIVIFGTTMYVS